MRGFESKISMECANKPASVGLRRGGRGKQDSTERNLAGPTSHSSMDCLSSSTQTGSWASGKRPFHLLTGTSSAHSPQPCGGVCPGWACSPILSPPKLFDSPFVIWPQHRGLFVGSETVTKFSLAYTFRPLVQKESQNSCSERQR